MKAIDVGALTNLLTDQIVAVLQNRGPKSKPRCLKCGAELDGKRRFWCDSKCGRRAHYHPFSIDAILKKNAKRVAA